MTKYAGRQYTRYALIAGFTEIGETMEETVQREVLEEVGLKVKNITYYKSQPWGFAGDMLLGFFCELDGSDEIKMDAELKFITSDGVLEGSTGLYSDGEKWYWDTDEVEEDSSGEEVVYIVCELPELLNEKLTYALESVD